MPPLTAPADQLAALSQGRAAVDLSSYRKVRARGDDARAWLHDLVTADVASLGPGDARRSLLLDATGHIRADVHVARDDEGYWLFQAPEQTDHIVTALAPYVLSSHVRLDDLSAEHGLIAVLGLTEPPSTAASFPSALGRGRDVLIGDPDEQHSWTGSLVPASAVEVWRILQGRARMGADFDRSTLPAEVGLESAIDITKGCFLGQESVSRVRNLGHPPRLLLHLVARRPVDAGSRLVTGDDVDAGIVTSAAANGRGDTVLLAMVPWAARAAELRSEEGVTVALVGESD